MRQKCKANFNHYPNSEFRVQLMRDVFAFPITAKINKINLRFKNLIPFLFPTFSSSLIVSRK